MMMKNIIIVTILLLVANFAACDSTKGKSQMNRLAKEKSPYLLQHADNPVDWYPWGEEAFEKARNEDKPIFLSIGYSTCHWCHVMEHESFEDSIVAALLNEYFVCIKVDREERPDIDNIYMAVCQMMTGSGGWPLTIIMTPDKKPFFAGTYFPKETRFGRIGMLELIPRIGDAWNTRRDELLKSADNVVSHLQDQSSPKGTISLGEQTLKEAFIQFQQKFDDGRGGFQGQRKFPTAHNLSFLLRYWKRTQDETALHIVEKTLQEMRKGGIYDHIGLGFHRYATDPNWLVPHFEKMLYDQAINAIAYIEAYQVTGKKEYARTATEIFTYILRDMTSPEGGFYSAEDADSEGEEGKFYLWTTNEIVEILGEKEGKFISKIFNVKDSGNFRDEASGSKTGNNILHLNSSSEKLAKLNNMELPDFLKRVEAARNKLFDIREKRIHPLKDDKILTDWNGLMIAALSKGAQVLDKNEYAHAAKDAADFILKHLQQSNGQLIKRYRDGVASLPAHLDDYAFFTWGLLELYETTFEIKYLKKAIQLTDVTIDLFWDEKNGAFFFTSDEGEALITRTKEIYDGALPSGNSVAALNLLRIGRITGNPEFEKMAESIGKIFSEQVNRSPSGYSQLLMAIDFAVGPSYEVVLVGKPDTDDTENMINHLQQSFIPNKVLLFKSTDESTPGIVKLAGFTETQVSIGGKTTAYVCQNYACKIPTTSIDEMISFLK